MPIPTITIDGTQHSVYDSLTNANAYLNAAYHADSWRAATDTVKNLLLVTATRLLNRQTWVGTKVDEAQPLAFPRTSMGITPEPIEDANDIPVDVIHAYFEIALAILDGSEVQNQQTTEERIRSMSAGSVAITYFRGVGVATRFPQIVHELLAKFLGGSSSTFGFAVATGYDTETSFPADLGFGTGGL